MSEIFSQWLDLIQYIVLCVVCVRVIEDSVSEEGSVAHHGKTGERRATWAEKCS